MSIFSPLRSIEQFVTETIVWESPVQQRLREETARLPQARMQIAPDVGALLSLLVRLVGARRALEIGTFTGYSALAIASALPTDGLLLTCDLNETWAAIARHHWQQAEVAERVHLHLGPALETLATLEGQGEAGAFDFAFIDADKLEYDAYYEACLRLLRPGGLIVLDNMLWSGRVAAPPPLDEGTQALRDLNLKIRDDDRVQAALLTVGDGLMLAYKRP